MADDLLATTRERARTNLFWRHLGVEVDDAGEGWVRLRVPVRDEIRNAAGAPVHGGVYSALVDMAVGGALGTLHAEAQGGVGPDDSGPERELPRRRAGRRHRRGPHHQGGRSIAFGEATIRDSAGTLVAVGRATYMILAGRS